MTRPSLEEIRRLVEAVSRLPWHVEQDWTDEVLDADGGLIGKFMVCGGGKRRVEADYIVAACNAVPALLDELEALRELEEAAKAVLDSRPEYVRVTLANIRAFDGLRAVLTKLDSLRGGKPPTKSDLVSTKLVGNQCDGCLAGRPLDGNGNHRMGDGDYADLMSCQRHRYQGDPPKEGT